MVDCCYIVCVCVLFIYLLEVLKEIKKKRKVEREHRAKETRTNGATRITHTVSMEGEVNIIKISINVLLIFFIFLALKLAKMRAICTRLHSVHAFKCNSIFVSLFLLVFGVFFLFFCHHVCYCPKYCWIQPGALWRRMAKQRARYYWTQGPFSRNQSH